MGNIPIWPEIDIDHAIMSDVPHSVKLIVRCMCMVRFAEKGVYYTVLHKSIYEEVFRDGEQKSIDFGMKVEAKAVRQFIRNVEISKMMYKVDPNLYDDDGNPIHHVDRDQTPEDERLKQLYLPQHV